MIVFFGDCDKHDLVVLTALILHVTTSQKVTIVPEDNTKYKRLNGETNGIQISTGETNTSGLTVYDCSKINLSIDSEDKLVMVTDHYIHNLEFVYNHSNDMSSVATILIHPERGMDRKYVKSLIPSNNLYEFDENLPLKLEMLDVRKLITKKVTEETWVTLRDLLTDILSLDKKDVVTAIKQLRKKV